MIRKRHGVGVAALEGKLYAAGGNDGTKRLSSAERYDPKTNTWEKIADMTTIRAPVGLVAMGGQLYAVGGSDGTSKLASVERYDVMANKWELLSASLGSKRSAHGIAAL
jgi:N-acetylneuraminic acid mutarotase